MWALMVVMMISWPLLPQLLHQGEQPAEVQIIEGGLDLVP